MKKIWSSLLLVASIAATPFFAKADTGSMSCNTADGLCYNYSDNRGTTDVNSQDISGLIDISATGTVPTFHPCDDCNSDLIPLGFSFRYFGQTYTDVIITSNGFITFKSDNSDNESYSAVLIPTPSGDIDNFIALLWTDLDADDSGGGDIFYETRGSAPNRQFIVYYKNVGYNDNASLDVTMSGEIVLHETTNLIDLYLEHTNNTDNGESVAIGIENADGSNGLNYLFYSPPSVENNQELQNIVIEGGDYPNLDNLAIRFSDGTCGNTFVDAPQGETCDDGNQVDGDGCDSKCVKEIVQEPQFECGNGIVEVNEQCDGGECCNAQCQIAVGQVCNDGSVDTEDDVCANQNGTAVCVGKPVPPTFAPQGSGCGSNLGATNSVSGLGFALMTMLPLLVTSMVRRRQ